MFHLKLPATQRKSRLYQLSATHKTPTTRAFCATQNMWATRASCDVLIYTAPIAIALYNHTHRISFVGFLFAANTKCNQLVDFARALRLPRRRQQSRDICICVSYARGLMYFALLFAPLFRGQFPFSQCSSPLCRVCVCVCELWRLFGNKSGKRGSGQHT